MAINRFEMPVRYGSTGDPIIRMRGITRTYQVDTGEATVLKNIHLEILQGQFVSVVGRSGSGKSTLVNMITGIDRPTSGNVEIGDLPVLKMHESEMAVWRGKNLGIVFQFFQLLPMLTLIENVMLPMDFCSIYSPASREGRALDLLRKVGLEDQAYTLPGEVAGGQQQCAAVARALANDPPILIADEPTGNLDSQTADQVMGIFEKLAADGKTILIVTHDRGLSLRTNRRLLISDGELVNEALYAALADVPHTRLLQLSKLAVSMHIQPGSDLPGVAGQAAPVYLVTAGEVVSGYREPGEIFGRGSFIDVFTLPERAIAGSNGVDLLALPREDLLPFISGAGLQNSNRSGGRDDPAALV